MSTKEKVLEALEKTVETVCRNQVARKTWLWRCRIGKYRVVYLIDEKERIVVFVDVGLRKSIYE